jgi:hypothetical protein
MLNRFERKEHFIERINKFFGIIAIIGFVLAGCATTKATESLGNTKPVEVSIDALSVAPKPVVTVSTNSLTVNDYAVLFASDHDGEWTNFWKLGKSGGTSRIKLTDIFINPVCRIANGKLTFDIGTPNNTALETMSGLGNDDSANAMFFQGFYDGGFDIFLKQEGKSIYFVYVDKPVTLNGTIANTGSRSLAFDNLSLQTGWNIALVDVKGRFTFIFSNVTSDPTDSTCEWMIVKD